MTTVTNCGSHTIFNTDKVMFLLRFFLVSSVGEDFIPRTEAMSSVASGVPWSRRKTVSQSTYIGFGVHTAAVMKCSVFWDVTPYSPLKVNRRFGRTCSLPVSCWFLVWFIRQSWGWYVHLKRRLTFNRLQGVKFQKTELFISCANSMSVYYKSISKQ
jgi:hypothetical protein